MKRSITQQKHWQSQNSFSIQQTSQPHTQLEHPHSPIPPPRREFIPSSRLLHVDVESPSSVYRKEMSSHVYLEHDSDGNETHLQKVVNIERKLNLSHNLGA